MRFPKPTRLDIFSFCFSMPFVAVILNLIMFEKRLWEDAAIWLVSGPLLILLGFLSWYLHFIYDYWVEHRFASLKQSGRRIFFKILIVFFVLSPSVLLIFYVYDHFHILGYQLQSGHLARGLLLGLSLNLVFETLYEVDYVLGKFKESREEQETLEQLAQEQDFNTLKNQVNPHFLFNCFNTLSSLISEDKKRAAVFLDELSKVYRYLLRNNEEGLSTLESELKFIESYYKLLQTRHGQAVAINIQTDKRYDPYLIPSLTLQLLVENVVKHNMLSKNKPLVIDIFTTSGNLLVVNNNLQRRIVKAPSNNIGLQNIQTKFELLKQNGFQVMEDENNFTVVLPLIWNNSYSRQRAAFGSKNLH